MKNSNAPRTSGAAPAVTLAEFQPRSARLRPRTTRAAVLAILALCHFLLIAPRGPALFPRVDAPRPLKRGGQDHPHPVRPLSPPNKNPKAADPGWAARATA